MIQTLEWTDKGVRFIDQTKLPTEETYVTCKTHEQVADVIRNMVVRGAPAIGVAAAMGIALGVNNSKAETNGDLKRDLDQRRAQPCAGPDAISEQQHAAEGDTRGRPHRRREARGDPCGQGELGRGKIGGGDSQHQPRMGCEWGDACRLSA